MKHITNTFGSGYLSDKPVSRNLATVLNHLHRQLRREFGCDFAYTVMGEGHSLATSNYTSGRIRPVTVKH